MEDILVLQMEIASAKYEQIVPWSAWCRVTWSRWSTRSCRSIARKRTETVMEVTLELPSDACGSRRNQGDPRILIVVQKRR